MLPTGIGAAVVEVATAHFGHGHVDEVDLRLAVLEELKDLRLKRIMAAEREQASALRGLGVTYQEIAERLGEKYQAVWNRYAVTEHSSPEARNEQSVRSQSRAKPRDLDGVSVADAAQRLGILPDRIYRLIRQGAGSSWSREVEIGGKRESMIRVTDISRLALQLGINVAR
jgi:hypothetical protein